MTIAATGSGPAITFIAAQTGPRSALLSAAGGSLGGFSGAALELRESARLRAVPAGTAATRRVCVTRGAQQLTACRSCHEHDRAQALERHEVTRIAQLPALRMLYPARRPQAWRRAHEQALRRPALVLAPLAYNSTASLALCCSMTTRVKGWPSEWTQRRSSQVPGASSLPGEGGVRRAKRLGIARYDPRQADHHDALR